MYNVDTLSLVMNFREYKIDCRGNKILNLSKINPVDTKIKAKLKYDDDTNLKMMSGRKDFGMRGRYDGYNFYYNCEWNSLTITVYHDNVESYTADEIIARVRNSVKRYFNFTEQQMVPIVLQRIDIKNDRLCEPEEEMDIIKNILYKARNSYRHYNKMIIDNVNGFSARYKSVRNSKSGDTYEVERQSFKSYKLKTKNPTDNIAPYNFDDETDEEGGNYIEYIFYDKGAERSIKFKQGKADEADVIKYKGMFRSEARVKNGRLNSNKFEHRISKELQNYYNKETTAELYDKYIAEIIGTRDFYRIDIAVEIVRSSNFRIQKRQALENLLLQVNQLGYTEAEKMWREKHNNSLSSFYNYKRALEKIGINILTFDKSIKGKDVKTEKIVNFGQRKNGVKEVK